MAETGSAMAFDLDRPLDGKRFKKVLTDAGYSQTALAETLGISCAHERQDVEVVYRRVKTDNPYNILVRLFWLGRTVSEPAIREKLPSLDIEQLEGVGLLHRRDGEVQANAKLAPYHDLLLASDFGTEIHRELSADHVLGVGAASLTLASLTVRRKVKTALDIGTGAGIQAFLAACHADQVIGTDTSLRALNFARFNAKLNGIDGVEWREGSLYEPVMNQQFDLIVSNPPYVISPESRFVFRDTNLPGDAVSEQVVREAGERLNEGGFACILFNWHHQDETDWDFRPKSWMSNIGCDGWLICFKTTDPLAYAADWLRTSVGQSSKEYGRCLDEWMAYYEQMGITRISAGGMIMRRRSQQANWFRAHAIDKGRCTGSCGDQIERIFAAEDLLQTLDNDRQLLEQRFLFDEHHRLEHQLAVRDGSWSVNSEHLYASEGIPFAGNMDMYIANLLAGCDGRRTLRELIEVVAGRIQADPKTVTPACLATVRKLMQAGFLSSAIEPETANP
ncbi:MAG TPA: class I SAM-dependent methyltransferase [Sedimentisphaerales bacterium]|nr:class I SAM-dependent methyltransferase [Sedimentisphaerales bacterium]